MPNVTRLLEPLAIKIDTRGKYKRCEPLSLLQNGAGAMAEMSAGMKVGQANVPSPKLRLVLTHEFPSGFPRDDGFGSGSLSEAGFVRHLGDGG